MAVNWHGQVVEQLDFYWKVSLRPRLEGLTDDEYFWEPVDGCWTVRSAGDGTFTIDWAWPPPDPLSLETVRWPGTADEAIALLDQSYAAWKAGVDALDEASLARPVGPAEGPWSEHPMAALIFHINREVMHHGAEVTLLRDLYRTTNAPTQHQ